MPRRTVTTRARANEPPQAGTRASARQAAKNASKSIHDASPVGLAEKRSTQSTKRISNRSLPMSSNARDNATGIPPKPPPKASSRAQQRLPVLTPVAGSKKKSIAGGGAPHSGPKGVRNPNYANSEDLWLCQSYVHCSEDPVVGVDQNADVFWAKIADDFEDRRMQDKSQNPHHNLPQRLPSSLKTRWKKKILPEVNRFMSCYKAVEQQPPSGVPPHQWPDIARENFRKRHGYEFGFIQCWHYLKDKNKFQCPVDVDLTDIPSTEDDAGVASNKKTQGPVNQIVAYTRKSRPIGRDAAKRLAAEELQIKKDSDSLTSDIPSLTSSVQDLVSTLKQRKESKESFLLYKKRKSDKKFRLDGYLKMAAMYTQIGNNDMANEFMLKAQGLLEDEDDQKEEEEEDDRKPAANLHRQDVYNSNEEEESQEVDEDDLLAYTYHQAKRFKMSQEDEEILQAVEKSEAPSFGAMIGEDSQESEFHDDFGPDYPPASDLPQGRMYDLIAIDRAAGIEWSNWKKGPTHGGYLPPFYYNVVENDDDSKNSESDNSEALLTPV